MTISPGCAVAPTTKPSTTQRALGSTNTPAYGTAVFEFFADLSDEDQDDLVKVEDDNDDTQTVSAITAATVR